jgi:hypothetical protein
MTFGTGHVIVFGEIESKKCRQISPKTIENDMTQDRIRGKHSRFVAGWLCVFVCARICVRKWKNLKPCNAQSFNT